MKKEAAEYIQNMKNFSHSRDNFLTGNWLRSLSSEDIKYLAMESGQEDRDLILTLTIAAIAFEDPQTEKNIKVEKLGEICSNMALMLRLELFSRHDETMSFRPVSIFSEEIRFIGTHASEGIKQ